MFRHHDSRTARTPCSSPPCGPRGATDHAHPGHPIVLAESEEEGRGDGQCAAFRGAMVAKVLRYTRQVLASTSKKGRTVAMNNLRAHEAEVVRKPIGEKSAGILAPVYSALLSGPIIEEAS